MLNVTSTDIGPGLIFTMYNGYPCYLYPVVLRSFVAPDEDFLEISERDGTFILGWIEQLPNQDPTDLADIYLE